MDAVEFLLQESEPCEPCECASSSCDCTEIDSACVASCDKTSVSPTTQKSESSSSSSSNSRSRQRLREKLELAALSLERQKEMITSHDQQLCEVNDAFVNFIRRLEQSRFVCSNARLDRLQSMERRSPCAVFETCRSPRAVCRLMEALQHRVSAMSQSTNLSKTLEWKAGFLEGKVDQMFEEDRPHLDSLGSEFDECTSPEAMVELERQRAKSRLEKRSWSLAYRLSALETLANLSTLLSTQVSALETKLYCIEDSQTEPPDDIDVLPDELAELDRKRIDTENCARHLVLRLAALEVSLKLSKCLSAQVEALEGRIAHCSGSPSKMASLASLASLDAPTSFCGSLELEPDDLASLEWKQGAVDRCSEQLADRLNALESCAALSKELAEKAATLEKDASITSA